jgi:hypothetical protein
MGNKSDLIKDINNKKVSDDYVRNFMSIQNIVKFFECSAKTKTNLIEPFEELCKGTQFIK